MYEEVRLLTHASIKICGPMTVYIDPFQIKDEERDADIILITHGHFDHYSLEDIKKVATPSTVMVLPKVMKGAPEADGFDPDTIEYVCPGEELCVNDVTIKAVPAYNVGKPFHPQDAEWVGYIVTMGGVSYYIAGDTDANDDVRGVSADVVLLPVGGNFTMGAEEAAELAVAIAPKLAIPTHYGSVAGTAEDGETFAACVAGRVPVEIRKEY